VEARGQEIEYTFVKSKRGRLGELKETCGGRSVGVLGGG